MQWGEKMTKEELSKDILKSAEELLEAEWKDGREMYHIARRTARLAGFTGKEEHFQEAIRLLRLVEHSKGWRDEVISLIAISYARTDDYAKAWEWTNKLYFNDVKDKTRLATIKLLLEKGRLSIVEKLLKHIEGPNLYVKALLTVAADTGKLKYFRQAYEFTLSTHNPAFDQVGALMDIAEILEKTIIQNTNAKNNDE